jgi:hypothetical protein
MGTSLTGLTPATTYDALIKVGDNGPLSATAKVLSDGLGNDSPLAMSTTQVGIGNSSPAATLDVASRFLASSNDGNAEVVLASTSNRSPLLYFKEGSTQRGLIYSAAGSNNLIFQSGTTEAMRINSAGNVGIGTASPSGKLTISQINTSGVAAILLTEDESTVQGPSANTYVKMGGNLTLGAAGVIPININNTERLRVTDNGLCFNGDTAAANALDDYEEGTWTMGMSFGGGTTGITYVNNLGRYTKIGRQVIASGYVALSSKGSSTGDAEITGLPFTNASVADGLVPVVLRYDNVSFTNAFQGFVNTSSNNISLGEITILGSVSNLTNADFQNGSSVMVSVTYSV